MYRLRKTKARIHIDTHAQYALICKKVKINYVDENRTFC